MKLLKSSTLGLVLASLLFGQFNDPVNPGIPRENNSEVQQNRTLTSYNNYNSLDHANMGVGILERQWSPFAVTVDFQSKMLRSEDDSSSLSNYAFMIPSMVAGTPDRIAFSAYYGVTPLSGKVADSLTLVMPLHHMGLGIAVQSESKAFRFGFNGDIFIGKSMYEETQDSGRTVLGVENISFSFGSSPHELLSFDFGVFTSAVFDSLSGVEEVQNTPNKKETYAEATLPVPGFNLGINFGESEYPVQSSFAFGYTPKNFSYITQRHDVTGGLGNPVEYHDKIKTDSISWHLKNRILIEPKRRVLKVNPSFEFGYMHNRHKRMLYDDPDKQKLPWKNGGENKGHRWETSAFNFGFGVDAQLYRFLDYWIEYGHSNMKLELTGDSLKAENNLLTDSHKEDFHRIATGFEFAIHRLPNVNYSRTGELFFDASFMHLQESGMYRSYYGSKQYEQFNDIDTDTQDWRYSPWDMVKTRVRTHDVSLGVRSTFAKKSIELAGRVHFVDQKLTPGMMDMSGPHFEFNVVYNLVERKVYK